MKENFIQRLWTSLIILGVFILLFAISAFSPFFEIAIAALICICIYEALTCAGCTTKKKLLWPSLIYGVAVPLSFLVRDFLYPGRSPYFGVIIIAFVYLISLFVFRTMISFSSSASVI